VKKTIFVCVFFLISALLNAQNIYTKTFGNSKDTPLIFLHGGPGFNCANFEATTAQKLADKGFFVIVYDRRGEGRSKDPNAAFTFQQTFADLQAIYKQYGLTKSTLIGHSFGGVLATLFAEKYPKKVHALVLVGAPVSLQETFLTIIESSKAIYHAKGDSVNLHYVSMLEKMNKTSLEYSAYCFMHAMQNGFYSPKKPSQEAIGIYTDFAADSLLAKQASQMDYQAPQGFWKNEQYTTLDLKAHVQTLKKRKIDIFALYGKEDGLYASKQVEELQNLIGQNKLKYLDNCSHNVFIDQQKQFLEALSEWLK